MHVHNITNLPDYLTVCMYTLLIQQVIFLFKSNFNIPLFSGVIPLMKKDIFDFHIYLYNVQHNKNTPNLCQNV